MSSLLVIGGPPLHEAWLMPSGDGGSVRMASLFHVQRGGTIMGRLLQLFGRGSAPDQPTVWLPGMMVDVEIVGESFHQDYLDTVVRRHGRGPLEMLLRPEPTNPYDSNAVIVLIDGQPVGHLARHMAREWQPMITWAESQGYAVVGEAEVCGGTAEKPNYGVFGVAPWPYPGPPPERSPRR